MTIVEEKKEAVVLDPVTIERTTVTGEVLGSVVLDPEFFSHPMNVSLLHQVLTAQLAASRSGTQSTRTRAEVRGGGSKPHRQKGTGSARQGSIRAPHFSGGGVALGPKPWSYAQRTPRKMIRQALCCALSDRAQTGGLRLIDNWTFSVPKTKEARQALESLGCTGRSLIVIGREEGDENAVRSFANLPETLVLPADQLTAYDVMAAQFVVFTDATLPGVVSPAPVAKRTRAKKAVAATDESESPAVEAEGEAEEVDE